MNGTPAGTGTKAGVQPRPGDTEVADTGLGNGARRYPGTLLETFPQHVWLDGETGKVRPVRGLGSRIAAVGGDVGLDTGGNEQSQGAQRALDKSPAEHDKAPFGIYFFIKNS